MPTWDLQVLTHSVLRGSTRWVPQFDFFKHSALALRAPTWWFLPAEALLQKAMNRGRTGLAASVASETRPLRNNLVDDQSLVFVRMFTFPLMGRKGHSMGERFHALPGWQDDRMIYRIIVFMFLLSLGGGCDFFGQVNKHII